MTSQLQQAIDLAQSLSLTEQLELLIPIHYEDPRNG